MPNRIIREGLIDSASVCSLTPLSREIYYRLLLVADDYGRLDGRPEWVRSRCFPVPINMGKSLTIPTVHQVETCLTEMADAEMLAIYSVDGKPFAAILNFGNKPRAKTSKYPPPNNLDENGLAVRAHDIICAHLRADVPLTVTETVTVTETETVTRPKSDAWGSACKAMTGTSLQCAAFREVWLDWVADRRERKKALTSRAIISQIRQLESFGLDHAIASVRRSIANGWQGIFAVPDAEIDVTPTSREHPAIRQAREREWGDDVDANPAWWRQYVGAIERGTVHPDAVLRSTRVTAAEFRADLDGKPEGAT